MLHHCQNHEQEVLPCLCVWQAFCDHEQVEERDHDESCMRLLPSETQLFPWSCKQFLQPVMQLPEDKDPVSEVYHQRQFRYLRNSRVRARARFDQHRAGGLFVLILTCFSITNRSKCNVWIIYVFFFSPPPPPLIFFFIIQKVTLIHCWVQLFLSHITKHGSITKSPGTRNSSYCLYSSV